MARSKRRQIVFMRPGDGGALTPLGSRKEVEDALARFNTARDGSEPKGMGTLMLYGPGMTVELPTSFDTVSQLMASVNDEDIAWPVLVRMCRDLQWQMMDVESGRVFGQ